ncbi:hypothetical protein [Bittarella massiliensis (ex Durand et al. 2017)]|uniref:Uncharacterized protein n=1 Tax=Bittarella massiliensis (ex Durand et al. 2017) TaxID=1720313 RepID=A0AAW5KGL1_9FIRM|nr:hypothetical protein [Bittarella massiliensis (ex Durand et al. 2017)]MCQ4949355.1 hypothetical protein [Bittarella massiliensis (ex Durand et al. 2017)]
MIRDILLAAIPLMTVELLRFFLKLSPKKRKHFKKAFIKFLVWLRLKKIILHKMFATIILLLGCYVIYGAIYREYVGIRLPSATPAMIVVSAIYLLFELTLEYGYALFKDEIDHRERKKKSKDN